METTLQQIEQAKVGKFTFSVSPAKGNCDNRDQRVNAITNWLLAQWRKDQREVRYVG